MQLGAVPARTIQRSPLSDRVRAAAGPLPTLTSVLAALSGNDVQVSHGWAGPKGNGSRAPRSITVQYVAGRTARRALVIAGVHGSEVQGIEVAQQLLSDPRERQAGDVGDHRARPVPRRRRLPRARGAGAHPNRNFPAPSKDLAASGPNPKDALGKAIRPENVMLMQLMERFSLERIISIHGTFEAS